MSCEEYRENLELLDSLASKEDGLQTSIAHVKECSECSETFANTLKLDELVREKMGDVSVPPFLASRIQAGIGQRHNSRISNWQWGYITAAFLFVGGLFIYNQVKIISRLEQLSGLVSQHNVTLPSTTTVSNQVNLLPSHNAILQRVVDEAFKRHRIILASKFVVFENNNMNEEFQGKFNFPLQLPNFSKELKLVGGSKCHSCVYEMAYLLYRQGRNSVSLCIFPDSDFGLSQWDGNPITFQKEGHNVAVWKKQRSVYALVFKLPVSEVRSMVWDLQEQQ